MPCLLIQLLRPRVRKGADPLLIADQESLLQIADQLIDLAVKERRFSLFIYDAYRLRICPGIQIFISQRADDLLLVIKNGADRMADHNLSVVNDTDQPSAWNPVFQRPIYRRFIFLLFNLPDHVPLIEVAVRMPVLGRNHGFPISCQYIDIGIPAFQIADRRQRMRYIQKNLDIRFCQIGIRMSNLYQLSVPFFFCQTIRHFPLPSPVFAVCFRTLFSHPVF